MTIKKTLSANADVTLTVELTREEFEDHFACCADCGEVVLKTDPDVLCYQGNYYCPDCTFTCADCGEVLPRDEGYSVEDSDALYCRTCFDEAFVCGCCHRHYRYESSLNYFSRDEEYYCDSCYDEKMQDPIAAYHTFKDYGTLHFLGDESRTDTPYMGFELEVDREEYTDPTDMVDWIAEHMPEDYFHFEHDGSLTYGWENISQPGSLSYHLSLRDRFGEMFEYLIENGMRSHDAGDCGLHIHLDRRYFGEREDSSVAKLLYIFEKFRPELMLFSRRNRGQADTWAKSRKSDRCEKNWIKRSIKDAKGWAAYNDRYFAVNLVNTNTVEIRLWRGTLNLETFMATLKFTARLAELCREVRAVDLAGMSFSDLLGNDEEILSYWNRVKGGVQ